jgi:hypothetical protein
MRHSVRIQPYISADLFRKLRAYAAAKSSTVSGVISEALWKYLEGDEVRDGVVDRRLEAVTHEVGQIKHDLETLAVGFGTRHTRGDPMETNQRKVGRPKSPPRTGPLVLGDDRGRTKVTLEITESRGPRPSSRRPLRRERTVVEITRGRRGARPHGYGASRKRSRRFSPRETGG